MGKAATAQPSEFAEGSADVDWQLLERVEFRTVIEDAPVMLWLTDPDGGIVFTNTRWKDFVGSEQYAIHGDNVWLEALHPDDRARVLDDFATAFKARLPFQMEYRLKRSDDEWRNVLDTGEPFHTSDGRFAGFVGSSTDISEHKRFEEELKRSHANLTRHNREMGWINQLNSYLQACRTLHETYPVIQHFATLIFPSNPGTLYLFNESRSLLDGVVSWGDAVPPDAPVLSAEDCWGLRQGKLHAVDASNRALGCAHVEPATAREYVCVPVVAQGEMVGMMHLHGSPACDDVLARGGDEYRSAWQQLISVTADNLGLAIVSLKLREALERQSVRDPLTGMYNRRHMEESLARELARSKRTGAPLGVIMLDLDHFKALNDEHGHDAGDAALLETARAVDEALRSSDIACRYGGEEFVLIMPDAGVEDVMTKADDLRASLERRTYMHNGEPLSCPTASLGVAGTAAGIESTADLLRAADRALYEAKRGGRNRVVAAGA